MAVLGEDDIQKIVHVLEAHGYSVKKRDSSENKVQLEEKHFRRIDRFCGDAQKWQEWIFAVCVAVGSVSADCVRAMEDAIKQAGNVRDVTKIEGLVDAGVRQRFGAEFGVLCS